MHVYFQSFVDGQLSQLSLTLHHSSEFFLFVLAGSLEKKPDTGEDNLVVLSQQLSLACLHQGLCG